MIKRLICWIGWHKAGDSPEHVFYSDRTMDEIHRCEWCGTTFIRTFGR